ncbi:MAG: alanine racemase [Pelagibacterales bacterium]|nr:alanine racemase [Pelagibacterales bacterium]
MHQTWLEISKSALLSNISEIRKNLSSDKKFIAVVKSNAYGHGLLEVASIIQNKVDYLASYHFEDLLLLRKKRIKKQLLCLGRVFSNQIKLAIDNQIEITVSTFDILQAAKRIRSKEKLKIHICIDSGLGRDGFLESDLPEVIELLKDKNFQKNVEVVGLYAHFASSDLINFDYYTKSQIEILQLWQESFSDIGLKPMVHASASAATLRKKALNFDAARVGLSIYGFWPSNDVKKQSSAKLKPVLSWRAKIVELKEMKAGSPISYNCTHVLKKDSKIAVLPIGYFDGIPRISSGKSFVLINGKKVPQIGRVTMNLIMIDVTEVKDVKQGDIVTIFGFDRKSQIKIDDWANWSQTSNYEISARLNSFLSRKVVR